MSRRKNGKVLKVIALVTVILGLYPNVLWAVIYFDKSASDQNTRVAHFLNYFPSFIRNASEITCITLMTAAISVLASIKWQKKGAGTEKGVAIGVLSISALMALLALFQLM